MSVFILTDDNGLVVNRAAFADDFKALTWDGFKVVRAQAAQAAEVGDTWDGRKVIKAVVEVPPPTRLQELRQKARDGSITDAEVLEATRLWLGGGA